MTSASTARVAVGDDERIPCDPRVLPVYRRFAQLREALVPYLTEQAAVSVETSKPLMRALFFDTAGDPEIWRWPFEYFLGDDLLVAPITEPGITAWRLYLPQGEWIDAWTGEAQTGPVTLERLTPLEEIPVYVCPGRARELLPSFVSRSPAVVRQPNAGQPNHF